MSETICPVQAIADWPDEVEDEGADDIDLLHGLPPMPTGWPNNSTPTVKREPTGLGPFSPSIIHSPINLPEAAVAGGAPLQVVLNEGYFFRNTLPPAKQAPPWEQRHESTPPPAAKPAVKQAPEKQLKAEQTVLDKLREAAAHAKYGDADAQEKVTRLLTENPTMWQQGGSMAELAQAILIEAASGGDPALMEMMRSNVNQMIATLASNSSGMLVQMAAQRVGMCWLFTQLADSRCSHAILCGAEHSDFSKMQQHAEKRYQTALKSLQLARSLDESKKPAPLASAVAGKTQSGGARAATSSAKAPRRRRKSGQPTARAEPAPCQEVETCRPPRKAKSKRKKARRKSSHPRITSLPASNGPAYKSNGHGVPVSRASSRPHWQSAGSVPTSYLPMSVAARLGIPGTTNLSPLW